MDDVQLVEVYEQTAKDKATPGHSTALYRGHTWCLQAKFDPRHPAQRTKFDFVIKTAQGEHKLRADSLVGMRKYAFIPWPLCNSSACRYSEVACH